MNFIFRPTNDEYLAALKESIRVAEEMGADVLRVPRPYFHLYAEYDAYLEILPVSGTTYRGHEVQFTTKSGIPIAMFYTSLPVWQAGNKHGLFPALRHMTDHEELVIRETASMLKQNIKRIEIGGWGDRVFAKELIGATFINHALMLISEQELPADKKWSLDGLGIEISPSSNGVGHPIFEFENQEVYKELVKAMLISLNIWAQYADEEQNAMYRWALRQPSWTSFKFITVADDGMNMNSQDIPVASVRTLQNLDLFEVPTFNSSIYDNHIDEKMVALRVCVNGVLFAQGAKVRE